MNYLTNTNKELKVKDNEGFYNPNQKGEFKGIFHGVDVEKQYYEAGAHFSYKDLCKRIERLLKIPEFKERSAKSIDFNTLPLQIEKKDLSRNNKINLNSNMTIDPQIQNNYITNNKEFESLPILADKGKMLLNKTRNIQINLLQKNNSMVGQMPERERKIYTTINNHSRNNSALKGVKVQIDKYPVLNKLITQKHNDKTNNRLNSLDFTMNKKTIQSKIDSNYLNSKGLIKQAKSINFNSNNKVNKIGHMKMKSLEYIDITQKSNLVPSINIAIPHNNTNLIENKAVIQNYSKINGSQEKIVEQSKRITVQPLKLQTIDNKINSLINKINELMPPKDSVRGENKTFRESAENPKAFKPNLKMISNKPIKITNQHNFIKRTNDDHQLISNNAENGKITFGVKKSDSALEMKSRNAQLSIGKNLSYSKNKVPVDNRSFMFSTMIKKNNSNYETLNYNDSSKLNKDNYMTERNKVISKPTNNNQQAHINTTVLLKQQINVNKNLLKSK